MIIAFYSIGLILLCLLFVSYPLFLEKLQKLQLHENETKDFSEQDSLLTSLSELEYEYVLGKWSPQEYQQQRLKLQYMYLELKKDTDDE